MSAAQYLQRQRQQSAASPEGLFSMSRVSSMTIGLVLIFIGTQLYLVKSYLLTPTATRFVQEHFSSNNDSMFASGGVQTNSNGWLGSGNNGSNWNANRTSAWGTGGNGSGNNGSITQAPVGQSWPYYRTDGGASNAGFGSRNGANNGGGVFSNSSYQQPTGFGVNSSSNMAAFGPGKRFVPPRWIMWPALFLGAVFFLHGAALRG